MTDLSDSGGSSKLKKWALCVGAFLVFWLVIDPMKAAFIDVFKIDTFYKKVFLGFKETAINSYLYFGTSELRDPMTQFLSARRYPDLKEGTIMFVLDGGSFISHKSVGFDLKTADGKSSVSFFKNSNNEVIFEMNHASFGKLVRKKIVSEDELHLATRMPSGKAIMVIFLWSFEKGIADLRINSSKPSQY